MAVNISSTPNFQLIECPRDAMQGWKHFIKTADEIVVMKKGEIIDKGNFDFLIKNNESFQKMVNLQELS